MVLLFEYQSLNKLIFGERLCLVEDSLVHSAHYIVMNTKS